MRINQIVLAFFLPVVCVSAAAIPSRPGRTVGTRRTLSKDSIIPRSPALTEDLETRAIPAIVNVDKRALNHNEAEDAAADLAAVNVDAGVVPAAVNVNKRALNHNDAEDAAADLAAVNVNAGAVPAAVNVNKRTTIDINKKRLLARRAVNLNFTPNKRGAPVNVNKRSRADRKQELAYRRWAVSTTEL